MRCFIALPLPAAVKAEMVATSRRLALKLPKDAVRWVKPENMHLTLTFLGDGVTAEQVRQLGAVLDKIAAEHAPFSLAMHQLGCFPRPQTPRVLWVGLSGETLHLIGLKHALDVGLEPLGWEPEKRQYNPHLTLGRVNDVQAVARARLPFGQAGKRLAIPADSICLYQSELRPTGSQYSVLHTAHFTP